MKKIVFATGSRAEYGILRNYLTLLNEDDEIELDIIATAALLLPKYGEAIKIIEEDGFNIAKTIDINTDDKDVRGTLNSMAVALKKFGDYLYYNPCDILIILGDRFEMMSVAIAAAMNKIPILHFHGGEITEGNYDEFIRHCITKMSTYHFVSTDEYRKRVIQLGEEPNNVYTVGALGSENCEKIDMANVPNNIIEYCSNKDYFVVLFHPETWTNIDVTTQIKELLYAVDQFISEYEFVFIGNNADPGSLDIRNIVYEFCIKNKNAYYLENLHPDAYHYVVKNAIALIGNSSSGIIEAPSLNTITINIGDRQKGRVRGDSIIDVKCGREAITDAIENILKMRIDESGIHFINPYHIENASKIAYEITKNLLKDKNKKIIKHFFDIPIND